MINQNPKAGMDLNTTPMEVTPVPINVHSFPMKLGDTTQLKKLNVARFPDQVGFDLNKLAAPIKMTPVTENEAELKEPDTHGMNRNQRRRLMEKYFEKLKELKTKKKLDHSWVMEDNDGEKTFEGILEGSQTASYCVFMLENNEFKVYPITNWYNFKLKHKILQTMTLEQAEAHLSNREETIEKAIDKFKSNKVKKEDTKVEGEPKEEEDEGLGGKPARVKREKKEDYDAEGEEDPTTMEGDKGEDIDFEEKVSDDDEGLEDEKNEDDENDVKNTEDQGKLTASGKELKSLLKKKQKEEEEFELTESEYEDEDENEEGFDPNTLDMYTKPKNPEEKKSEGVNKRPFPGSDGDKDAKKAKVDGPASTEVSEEEVRKAVLLAGKIKTKTLLSKFKGRLTYPSQKARFADNVKRLCDIVDDFGEKWLVLKEAFRGGLKVPK